jgi:hypothetical protein
MARILLFLSLATFLFQCQGDSGEMKAIAYANGSAIDCILNASAQDSARALLQELFAGTQDMLRVRVSDESVDAVRRTDTAMEFVFNTPAPFTSRMHGAFSVRRLVIPVTGDYAGSEMDPVATLFVADDQGFISGPLRNPAGRPLVLKLQSILTPGTRPR